MISKLFTAFLFSLLSMMVFSQKNIDFVGQLQFNEKINDIWAYEDINGNEYALVGGESGTYIVDVSVPTNPIELFYINGQTTTWRDIKTYNDFAYVTNESGGGLLIIDLSNLPNNINFQRWTGDNIYNYQTAHNIFIDENGIGHLFGSNIENKGDFMINLNNTIDRYDPTLHGIYNDKYCHDGFVRDNFLWSAEVNDGDFSAVSIFDPQNQTVLARQQTSSTFTHNCWLSDDDNYLITTDEVSGAYVDIYDVSDVFNITLIDKYQSSPGEGVVPHNTFFKGNDYIFTSYYRDGVTLVDATRKNNLVEVGQYDTSPFPSTSGFEGCWGVYPYLTSGNILASDREEGLFILKPTYKRACYLEGNIIDTSTLIPISNAKVEILGTKQIKNSIFDGSYTTGVADSSIYDIKFTLPNCQTLIVSGVELLEGQVKILDIKTNCDSTSSTPTTTNDLQNDNYYIISPNPSSDYFKIDFNSSKKLKAVQIVNFSGKLIKEIEVDATKGNLIIQNDWVKGNYLALLIFEDASFQEILVKK